MNTYQSLLSSLPQEKQKLLKKSVGLQTSTLFWSLFAFLLLYGQACGTAFECWSGCNGASGSEKFQAVNRASTMLGYVFFIGLLYIFIMHVAIRSYMKRASAAALTLLLVHFGTLALAILFFMWYSISRYAGMGDGGLFAIPILLFIVLLPTIFATSKYKSFLRS